jgi:enoyl-CoA hydratase/carnithine racemase
MSALHVTQVDRVLVVEGNDPPINRMSLAYIDEWETLLDRIESDPNIRAVVVTAAGDTNFSVGMDLKELTSQAASRGGFEAVLDQRRRVLHRIETLPKPVIATLFGYCLGGGLELPLACHFRLAAAEGARIGLPELDLGTVPAWGGSARLTRTIGRSAALDMILRARKIDGPEAYRLGLVNEVVPLASLKARAMELAAELARQPAAAVAGVLRAVAVTVTQTLDEALDCEREAVRACSNSPDQREGMMAFMEKRRPNFA